VGDLIDNRFEVYRVLKGGMGIVYICIEQETGVPCAIKTFQDKYLLDEEARRRFVRESETWVSLGRHRNIVKAKGVEVLSGKPNILLEYVNGGNLRDKLERGGLSVSQALYLAVQFCDGMIFATTIVEGLVHRDITPGNIMITPDGVVKITDFGLVKALGAPTSERSIGTPEYMSPEQFHTMDVDTRSDIYSFGVVLYEMIIGRPPFRTENEEERWSFCEKQHINTIPKNPRSLNSEIPASLDSLVMKCLEKEPNDRYQSFEALRQALDNVYFEISSKHVSVPTDQSPETWERSNRGYSLVELGRLDEGIAILKQTIQNDQNYPWAHLNLGYAYSKKGWLDQAITEYKLTLEIDPSNVKAYLNLGVAYIRKGWTDQAIAELKRATELQPNFTEAHQNLGIAYAEKGLLDQAIIELKRATELDPNHSGAHLNLGAAYHKKSWTDQAIAEYKRSLEIDPKYAVAHLNLAAAYYHCGRFDLAWKHLHLAEHWGAPTQNILRLKVLLSQVSRES
jgi:serine/threonine protein kinase